MAVVVAIQGPSGSGKTTLIEQLISRLVSRGVKVGVIKHTHQGFSLDQRGKDSHRFWESGAQAVLAAGPSEVFVRQHRTWAHLSELLEILPQDLDCVLIEGFTHWVTALDVSPSVRAEVSADVVRVNGQPIVREEAVAALEVAIVRCLEDSRPVCPG